MTLSRYLSQRRGHVVGLNVETQMFWGQIVEVGEDFVVLSSVERVLPNFPTEIREKWFEPSTPTTLILPLPLSSPFILDDSEVMD